MRDRRVCRRPGSAYEFVVTPELSAATDAFLRGEGGTALALIDKAEETLSAKGGPGDDNAKIYAWYLSYFRVQALIQLGRGPDAEAALVASEAREMAAFGTNVNTRAAARPSCGRAARKRRSRISSPSSAA